MGPEGPRSRERRPTIDRADEDARIGPSSRSPGARIRTRSGRHHRRHGDRADRRGRVRSTPPRGRPSRRSRAPSPRHRAGSSPALQVNAKTGRMVFTRHNAAAPAEVYVAERGRLGPDPAHPPQRPPARAARPAQARGLRLQGRRRRRGPRLAAPPAGIRPEQEIPGRLPDPRRAAGRLARRVAQPLELPDVRRAGICPRGDQPARVDRLRAEVHRPDQPGLDRQGLRGPHERAGSRPQDLSFPR